MNIVKELRKKAGIQQKELAIIIGVSRPTVSEWESNKKDPSGERLKRLAEYFGVDELMVLGKGVVDLSAEPPDHPQTEEARLLSYGVDQMPKEQREQALKIFQTVFTQYADYFKRKDDDDEGRL